MSTPTAHRRAVPRHDYGVREPGLGPRLVVERSGGLAGLALHGSFALDELSPAQRSAVEECLGRWRRSPANPPPDRFLYRLRLGRRRATVPESALPAVLREVFRRLTP